MSVDFRKLTAELRSLVTALEDRCRLAEARQADLQFQLDGEKARSQALETSLRDVTTRYKNLQASYASGQPESGQAQSDGLNVVREQRDRYLAMVRVIDDCIAKLAKRG